MKARAFLVMGGVLALLLAAGAGVRHLRTSDRGSQGLTAAFDPAVSPLLARWREGHLVDAASASSDGALAAAEADAAFSRGIAAWHADLGRTARLELERSAALDPQDETLAWLVAVGARWPTLGGLDATQRDQVLSAIDPRTSVAQYQGARAWHLFAEEGPAAALAALDPAATHPEAGDGAAPGRGVLASSAELRARRALGQRVLAAAERVLSQNAGDVEACVEATRATRATGDFAGVEDLVVACQTAGVDHPSLSRALGWIYDAAGEPADACAAYLAAGTALHAAAIVIQGGGCAVELPEGLVEKALAEAVPEAALHATWAALLVGDAVAIEQGLLRLSPFDGPPFRAGRAAALLSLGRAQQAFDESEALSSAPASVLTARALAALGRDTDALAAATAAVRQAPWSFDAHRTRLALTARLAPAELSDAVAELAAVDPVTLALAGLEPDRLVPWAAIAPDPWPISRLSEQDAAVVQALAEGRPLRPWDPVSARADLAGALLVSSAKTATAPGDLVERAGRALSVAPDDPLCRALAAVALAEGGRLDDALALMPPQTLDEPVTVTWARIDLALQQGRQQEAEKAAAALVLRHPAVPGLRALQFSVRAAATDAVRARPPSPESAPANAAGDEASSP